MSGVSRYLEIVDGANRLNLIEKHYLGQITAILMPDGLKSLLDVIRLCPR